MTQVIEIFTLLQRSGAESTIFPGYACGNKFQGLIVEHLWRANISAYHRDDFKMWRRKEVKDDKSDREGSTYINRAVKEHFKQRKCNWYQCGGNGETDRKGAVGKGERKEGCLQRWPRAGLQTEGVCLGTRVDLYPSVNHAVWTIRRSILCLLKSLR